MTIAPVLQTLWQRKAAGLGSGVTVTAQSAGLHMSADVLGGRQLVEPMAQEGGVCGQRVASRLTYLHNFTLSSHHAAFMSEKGP